MFSEEQLKQSCLMISSLFLDDRETSNSGPFELRTNELFFKNILLMISFEREKCQLGPELDV